MADQRAGPRAAGGHCRGRLSRTQPARRGEDVLVGRDGRGRSGNRSEDCQPASLASAAGFLLAASLAVSGLGYILLAPGIASAVFVAGFLLLAFVTGTGITLRHLRDGEPDLINRRQSRRFS